MKIAIHQVNFFPHLAFFEKMSNCDVFVLMSHCQFEKNGYQNRFKVGSMWNTMSVSKKTDFIWKKKYVNPIDDWRTIRGRFTKDLSMFDPFIGKNVASTNSQIIMAIAAKLDIKTEIVFDYRTKLTGTDRLVHICKKYKATEYLSGPSGKNYLDVSKFGDIKVSFQESSKSVPITEVI